MTNLYDINLPYVYSRIGLCLRRFISVCSAYKSNTFLNIFVYNTYVQVRTIREELYWWKIHSSWIVQNRGELWKLPPTSLKINMNTLLRCTPTRSRALSDILTQQTNGFHKLKFFERWINVLFFQLIYLIGCVGGSSVMAISDAALYATREFSAASLRSFPVANSAKYLSKV